MVVVLGLLQKRNPTTDYSYRLFWCINKQSLVSAHLQVVLGVPVGVKDDAGICSCQVDSKTSCSGAQQKHKAVRVGFAEPVDGGLTQVPSDTAVDTLVRVAAEKGPTSLILVKVPPVHQQSLAVSQVRRSGVAL